MPIDPPMTAKWVVHGAAHVQIVGSVYVRGMRSVVRENCHIQNVEAFQSKAFLMLIRITITV